MKKMVYIILAVFAAIILAFVIIDGSFLSRKYNKAYKNDYYEDDLHNIINYAIGAASGHNMQPWLVKIIDENTIELYADMDKQLKVVDPENTQLLMGQGAFIQKFKSGAQSYGYEAEVEYADIDLNSQLPLIAGIKIEKISDVTVDTASMSTINAEEETQKNLDKAVKVVMKQYDGFKFEYISESDDLSEIQEILLRGTIVESNDIAAMEELINVFRFTEWQKNKYKYGLSLNAMPDIIKPFAQPIVKLTANNIETFGKSSIKMYEDRLSDDIGYLLIKKDNPQSIDFVKLGEIYQQLINSKTGYSMRPSMQVLEEFDAMKDLNEKFKREFGDDGDVLIILNVQKRTVQTASNPRHLAEDIIID